MPAERYFLDTPLQLHEIYELKDTEFHHLAHVMRTRKGENVEIVNGKGSLGQAIVQDIRKEKAWLKIEEVIHSPVRAPRLILAQAIPKPNRLDFILEKGTELGVDLFWLFPGDTSPKKELFPHQVERAQTLTIAAMKQCGRLTLPEIVLHPSLKNWKPLHSLSAFYGDVNPKAPLIGDILTNSFSSPMLFFTGPEAGFSEQEEQVLKNLGVQGVKLHENILRTDTASLMALSLLSHWQLKNEKNQSTND